MEEYSDVEEAAIAAMQDYELEQSEIEAAYNEACSAAAEAEAEQACDQEFSEE